MSKIGNKRILRRKKRVSSKITGTKSNPRISVFASNRYTYVQIIDDSDRKTLAAFSSLKLAKSKDYQKNKKVSDAKKVGIELAKFAQKLKITKAVFDRGRYSYKGRVKAIADGLREGGIQI